MHQISLFKMLKTVEDNLINKEITTSKLLNHRFFDFIQFNNDIFNIDLKELDFRNIKNLNENFNWNNLEKRIFEGEFS